MFVLLMVRLLLFIFVFLLVELVKLYMWFCCLLGLMMVNWLIIVLDGLFFWMLLLDKFILVGFLLMFRRLIIRDFFMDFGGLLLLVDFIVIW